MTDKVYITLDIFHSAAYSHGAGGSEDYSHDDQYYYLVLQPLLIHGSANAPSPRLNEYMGWAGANLQDGTRIELLSRTLADKLKQEFASGTHWTATPVPLPPATDLQLKVDWTKTGGAIAGSTTVSRTLGLGTVSPFGLSVDQWPVFVERNYASLSVKNYEDLSAEQLYVYLDWLYSLIIELKDKTTKGAELTDTQKYVFDKYVKDAVLPNKDNSRTAWAEYLTKRDVNPVRAALIYRDLYEKSFSGDGRPKQRPLIAGKMGLHPPRIRYTPEQMRDPRIKDKLFSPARDTYFEWLWLDMKELAQTDADGDEKPTPEESAAQAFSRLYGFGERLRWPHPTNPDDLKHFMIVKMYDEHSGQGKPNPWFVTNAHSLAGQVFRIGKINDQEPIESVLLSTLNVQGRSIITDTDKTNFNQVFKTLIQEAKALKQNHLQFSARLTRDRESPNGRVTYLPKNARGQWTGFTTRIGDTNQDVYNLPGAIMDSLTPAGRVEFPLGSWLGWKTPYGPSLIQVNPPRTMLSRDEMFLDGKPLGAQPLVQTKMALRLLALAGMKGEGKAYELKLASDLHDLDKAQVNESLKRMDTDDSASIWIMPTKEGDPLKIFPLKGHLLGTEQRDGNTVYIIADPDGKLTGMLPQWTGKEGTAQQKSMIVQFVCNAIFDDAQRKYERFNWLAQKTAEGDARQGPFIVLRNHFTNTPSTSAERIFERFTLTLDPAPPLIHDETKPILDHFINFNKLRVGISRNGLEGMQLLTYPDALTPLGLKPADMSDLYEVEFAGGFSNTEPEFWYKIAHSFSQQFGETRPQATPEQARDDAAATESMRYLCYVTAGTPWNLMGWVEHQYGYRVPVNGGSISLPLSTDIRNIANLSYKSESHATVPAIFYDHRYDQNTRDEWVQLWLNQEYFKMAYQESGFDNPSAKPEELNPSRLRALYEAIADMVSGEATLELERWNFNNKFASSASSPAGISAEEDDTPSITANLQYLESATFRLDKIAYLAPIKKLLEGSFKDFLKNLGDALKRNDPLWNVILLKMNDSNWKWSKTLERSPLYETTNVIRLGLKLKRRTEAVLGQNYLSAKFRPLRPDLNKSGDDLDTVRFKSLDTEAKAEMALYLTPPPATPTEAPISPLYQSFGWITSQDLDQRQLLQDPRKDSLRFRKLFGEVLPQLNFPTGLQSKVENVVDIFYVLYSFSPLEPHPAFGDPQTTLEFAEFLMLLLDDLAKGISTNLISIRTGQDRPGLETALRDRRQALNLLAGVGGTGGIAGKLLDLCFRVDDLEGLKEWKDPVEKALFDKVNEFVKSLNQLATGQRLGDALHSMLAANPALFTYSKAIAVGVFHPETYSERIYNLQVTKRIRLPQAKATQTKQVDTDRDTFTFLQFQGVDNHRFFLDVLDDASYDNEFEIDQNTYSLEKPIGSRRKASEMAQTADGKYARGAARARSAEDVIEQQNLLDEESTTLRQLEVNVVHYNPEWRTKNKDDKKVKEWLYILPSRRFPVIPKPVLPSASAAADGAEVDTPWHTRLQVKFPSEEPTEDFDLDGQFEERLREKLKETVKLPGTLASDAPLDAQRIDFALAFPSNKEDREGWYHTESYLSLYYFIVEADEEADVNGFRNDAFEIQVQTDPNLFPPSEALQSADVEFKTNLQRWFNYQRVKHAGGKADLPPELDIKEVLDEVEAWCLNPLAKPELKPIIRDQVLLRKQQVVEDSSSDDIPGFRRAEFAPNATNATENPMWTLTVFKNKTAADAIGSVMAAELFKFLPRPGALSGDEEKRKYLIRVAVLDDPWRFTRVRMRVKRNRTDVDQNHDPDINPQFSMVTKYSDWVSYGRHVMKLNAAELPLAARFLRIEPDEVHKVPTRQQWLNKNLPPTEMVSFGPIVEKMMKKQFKSKSGLKSLWGQKEAMGDTRQVLGTMLQLLPDNHPRQTATGPATRNSVPERGDQLIKQYLGPVMGPALVELATQVEKKNPIADPALHLMVTWYTTPKSGGPNLPPGDKLLEITWPIRWK